MSVVRRGGKWCIRYYGPDGRQRWETIGPNRKEAETVLHQRQHESLTGIYPILRRRRRLTFTAFAEEWKAKHLPLVRASTAARYKALLTHQLLPAFGDRILSGITPAVVQTFITESVQARRLAPKTVNHALALLKQLLATAAAWGYLPRLRWWGCGSCACRGATCRCGRRPNYDGSSWRRRKSGGRYGSWRCSPGYALASFQALSWTERNWPDFTANKIHVTCGYEEKSKVLGAPKTDRSVRDVDMVPAVRQVLEALPSRAVGGPVFPGADGGMFARTNMKRAWVRTITAAKVRPIRPYDLRHAFASLLIAAGKNPLYIARQLGHYSAGFTLDTYGHLIESVPKRQVEWIDELVFPEGYEAALNLHLYDALRGGAPCSPVQSGEAREALKTKENAASCNPVQPDAWQGRRDSNPRPLVLETSALPN